MRLLEGKRPFLFPPPRSYGYPAYHWIEADPGAKHRVQVFFSGAGVIVDQTLVDICSRNASAQSVEKILASPFDSKSFVDACEEKPVWKIKYPHWPVFSLSISRTTSGVGKREWVERHVSKSVSGVSSKDVWNSHWLPEIVEDLGEVLTFSSMSWVLLKDADDWTDTVPDFSPFEIKKFEFDKTSNKDLEFHSNI